MSNGVILDHIIEWEPGYDCITFECKFDQNGCRPGEEGCHGRHAMTLRFVVKGPDGAVQFVLYTDWLPIPCGTKLLMNSVGTMPADLGVHSRKPLYENQTPIADECKYTEGPCYYDGSGLNAYDAYAALVNQGIDALWTFLDGYYESAFRDTPYPTPPAYCKPKRSSSHD